MKHYLDWVKPHRLFIDSLIQELQEDLDTTSGYDKDEAKVLVDAVKEVVQTHLKAHAGMEDSCFDDELLEAFAGYAEGKIEMAWNAWRIETLS